MYENNTWRGQSWYSPYIQNQQAGECIQFQNEELRAEAAVESSVKLSAETEWDVTQENKYAWREYKYLILDREE